MLRRCQGLGFWSLRRGARMFRKAITRCTVQPWKWPTCGATTRFMTTGGTGSSPPSSSSDTEDDEQFKDVNLDHITEQSYGVRKTAEWLNHKKLLGTSFRLSNIVDPAVNTGMYVDFPHGLSLAVETHPVVCSSDFAETAVMPTKDTNLKLDVDKFSPRLIALKPLGYSQDEFTLRHKEPEQLFQHITKFSNVLEDADSSKGVVQLAGGESIDLNRDAATEPGNHLLVDTVEAPNSGVLTALAKQALY